MAWRVTIDRSLKAPGSLARIVEVSTADYVVEAIEDVMEQHLLLHEEEGEFQITATHKGEE